MECSILVYTISVNEVFVLGYYLPTTISKRHRKSGAVCLWRRSRQGSELARDITSSNAILYLLILAATACTSSVRAGSAACGAGRFRPSPPPGTCQTSLPNAPHLHIPTLMAAGNIFHG